MSSYSGSASGATAVDLSRLPFPDVIETLSFDRILAERKARLIELAPELEPVLALPSEPLVKFLEADAYRELNWRARVNDAARAQTLAHARGADLDNLVALFGVVRLTITPADPVAGTGAVMEDDEALRRRALLAPDSYSVAGPAAAYVYHAMSAHGAILDAAAHSPSPGVVMVTVLGRDDGPLDPAVLEAATAAVTDEAVRPLTDLVQVQAAQTLDYQVKASLDYWSGPDAQVARVEARQRVQAYVREQRRLGRGATRSGLIAALHPDGVRNVNLIEPAADVTVDVTQAAACRFIRIDGETLPETRAALAAMVVQPDPGRAALLDDLIAALITAGVWERLTGFWLMAAHHSQAARINLKTPGLFDLTAVNSPTFVIDEGFRGDGVAAHLTPGAAWGQLVEPSSAHMGVWTLSAPAPGPAMGHESGTSRTNLYPMSSGGEFVAVFGAGNVTLAGVGSGVGHYVAQRDSATNVTGFLNGAKLADHVSNFVALHGTPAQIMRHQGAYSRYGLAAAHTGFALSPAQGAALTAALSDYLVGVGALS